MMSPVTSPFLSSLHHAIMDRRTWLRAQAQLATQLAVATTTLRSRPSVWPRRPATRERPPARVAAQAQRLELTPVEALARRAVDAARAAGATYADARLTRIVYHVYSMRDHGHLEVDDETLGVGVRALVDGYWGFAASPYWEPDEVIQLARDAVAQAKDNIGTPRTVELGPIPTATGRWATPVEIDPFTIPIEEKLDFIVSIKQEAARAGVPFVQDGQPSHLTCARQERVIATSEGALFLQTLTESGGTMLLGLGGGGIPGGGGNGPTALVPGIAMAGQGWERLQAAPIVAQFPRMRQELLRRARERAKVAEVGRYTLVCDGATMGALVTRTWGVATQLDRALGYEANASGTSLLTDPLAMAGHLMVASDAVTITANRSAPTQLATVKWDDEGVIPEDFALITQGRLMDFQTTREQASWLAPYYQQAGRPVRSHGCAAAESGLAITLQHLPNLAMAPSPTGATQQELIASVRKGLLIEDGIVETDFQVTGGMVWGTMHEITNGQVGRVVTGGAIEFRTLDLWKNVVAVAGAATQVIQSESQYALDTAGLASYKGQPGQAVSHTVSGVAAVIANQPLIDPARKA